MIESFNYGPTDIRNRPPLITEENLKKGHIKMSASEISCFVKYLGLMIGDLVPEHSQLWLLYIIFIFVLNFILPFVLLISVLLIIITMNIRVIIFFFF